MSNTFYNHTTGQPVAISRGSSSVIRAEFDAVQAGFDAVQTALTVKAATTGQVWTGVNDFTGATIRVPTPTNIADAVTKAYADNLIAAATAAGAAGQFPNQAGNAGKFAYTNGSVVSWAYAGIASVNAPITTSTTLAVSYLYVPVAMSALGQSITLPSALTLSTGGPLYIIDNTKGAYPVGIRDNTGTLIMAVAPGGEAFVSLKDITTQAGVWSLTGSNLEPGLITIDNTFSSTYGTTILAPFVALDNNTSLHFAALSSGFAAFVVDNAGKVLTTPVTVSSTASSQPRTAFKISATQAIVFFGSSASDHQAVVLTISGASPAIALAVGTPQALVASFASCWGGENFTSSPRIAQLSPTLYLAAGCISGQANGVVAAISVSGSTITIGATAVVGAATFGAQVAVFPLTATTGAVVYKVSAVTTIAVVSISGTTCTVNTPATSPVASSTGNLGVCALISPTKVITGDDNNASAAAVAMATISGTTVTFGSTLTVEAVGSAGRLTYDNANRYNPQLWLISAGATNTIGIYYFDISGWSRLAILTENGGTITAGPLLYKSFSSAASTSNEGGAIFPQGTTELMGVKAELGAAGTIARFRAIPCKVSGSNITVGISSQTHLDVLDAGANVGAGPASLSMVRLGSGDYTFRPGGNTAMSGLPILRSNGDFVNYRGAISIPTMYGAGSGGSFSNFNNRIVLLCNADWVGTSVSGGASQLRLLNVEIAA